MQAYFCFSKKESNKKKHCFSSFVLNVEFCSTENVCPKIILSEENCAKSAKRSVDGYGCQSGIQLNSCIEFLVYQISNGNAWHIISISPSPKSRVVGIVKQNERENRTKRQNKSVTINRKSLSYLPSWMWSLRCLYLVIFVRMVVQIFRKLIKFGENGGEKRVARRSKWFILFDFAESRPS